MSEASLRPYFDLFLEIGIIEQLSRAMFEARLPEGVLVSHFSVLSHLMRVGDGRTPLQMATAFQVPKTTLSHTLALVEKRGWVEMRPNPEDKRSKQVWLTEAGRAFHNAAIAKLGQDLAMIAERFGPDWLDTVKPQLSELRAFLDAARDA